MLLRRLLRSFAIAGCAIVMLPECNLAQTNLASPGVSRELAAWRSARYRDVSYAMDIAMEAPFAKLRGRVRLHFQTEVPDGDLILDWRPEHEARLLDIAVNDAPAPAARIANEHLIIAQALLRPGENEIALEFEAPVASAGTALTLFHDPQDGAGYIYSLFVPADASSVFPCFDQPDLKARFELNASAPANWKVISNAPEILREEDGSRARVRFAATPPISTY